MTLQRTATEVSAPAGGQINTREYWPVVEMLCSELAREWQAAQLQNKNETKTKKTATRKSNFAG